MSRKITTDEAAVVLSCGFTPRYSGSDSEKFWKEIKRTNDRTLYDFACALQDAEWRLLAVLNAEVFKVAEAKVRQSKRRGAERRK